MILSKQDLRNFVRLIGALDPWLKDLVIIGGWAYRLYRLHPMAQQLAYPPVITPEGLELEWMLGASEAACEMVGHSNKFHLTKSLTLVR